MILVQATEFLCWRLERILAFLSPTTSCCPKKEEWLNFLKKGKNFYLEDIECNRYYIPKRKVKKAKKDLEI